MGTTARARRVAGMNYRYLYFRLFSRGALIGVRSSDSTRPALNKPFPRPTGLKDRGGPAEHLVNAHGMAPLEYVFSPLDVVVEHVSHRFIDY